MAQESSSSGLQSLLGQPTVGEIGVLGVMGRNGFDSTFLMPSNQCREAYNIDWYQSALGRKRPGSSKLSVVTPGTPFAVGAAAMGRFVPGADQTAAELWAMDFAFNFHRLAGSAIWADPGGVVDACTATAQEVNFLQFNGKLYISYKSAHNRMHCYDPATGTIRRTGLDLPAAPASVVLSVGTITDTREYRIAWTKQVSGVTTYRSNLGPVSASQAMVTKLATITQPTPPGEGETHWEVWGSSNAGGVFADFRLVATTVIGTTTAVDNAALSTTVAPLDGENTPMPSARYMASDDSRIILAGAYELGTHAENAATPSVRRVWWSPALGSATGDDERIEITGGLTGGLNNYADLEEAITGLSTPMQVSNTEATSLERGSFYVFSYESQWKFISTGDATAPYLKFRITGGAGAIHHKSIISAIDTNGNPAIYWWSQYGPFRISADGQQYLGQDLSDILPRVNLNATIPVHTVYHHDLRQVWFHVALDGSAYPNYRLVFDTLLGQMTSTSGVRFGWSIHQGEGTKAYCSAMFAQTVGASMDLRLKPYVGYTGAVEVWKCDDTAAMDDAGTPYQAYVDTRSYAPWGLGKKGGLVGEPFVIANPSQGVTVQLTAYRNEGAESNRSKASLTDLSDTASAALVFAKFEGAALADTFSFRCRIGDATAISNSWNLQGLMAPWSNQGSY